MSECEIAIKGSDLLFELRQCGAELWAGRFGSEQAEKEKIRQTFPRGSYERI